jgi:hypothetical protein
MGSAWERIPVQVYLQVALCATSSENHPFRSKNQQAALYEGIA